MKKLLLSALSLFMAATVICKVATTSAPKSPPTFESAVELIKSFEGMHKPKNWPYIGYGHRVLKGEKYKKGVQLSEAEAEALLRKDLKENCALYRAYGADSLLLGALAYNVGRGTVNKSSILKKLKAGDREIESVYMQYCRYRGKVMPQIQRRRKTELETLFVKETTKTEVVKKVVKKA